MLTRRSIIIIVLTSNRHPSSNSKLVGHLRKSSQMTRKRIHGTILHETRRLAGWSRYCRSFPHHDWKNLIAAHPVSTPKGLSRAWSTSLQAGQNWCTMVCKYSSILRQRKDKFRRLTCKIWEHLIFWKSSRVFGRASLRLWAYTSYRSCLLKVPES